MKLIRQINEEIKFLTESTTDGSPKKYFIEGIFIQCEKPNRNNRKYSLDSMKEEVERYTNEYVKQNRAYGELGHPESATINMPLVSHLITDLRLEGTDFIGRAKILDTPNGKIVKTFMDEGCKLGVSTRGLGSLQQEGNYSVVQSDYKIMTAADIVADPSAQEAFVEALIESREWIWNDGRLMEIDLNNWKNIIHNSGTPNLEEIQLKIFSEYLSKISSKT
jgi:hypothetical protein